MVLIMMLSIAGRPIVLCPQTFLFLRSTENDWAGVLPHLQDMTSIKPLASGPHFLRSSCSDAELLPHRGKLSDTSKTWNKSGNSADNHGQTLLQVYLQRASLQQTSAPSRRQTTSRTPSGKPQAVLGISAAAFMTITSVHLISHSLTKACTDSVLCCAPIIQ